PRTSRSPVGPMPAMIARVPAPNVASCFCLIEDVMRPKLEGTDPAHVLPRPGLFPDGGRPGDGEACIAVSNWPALPRPADSLIFRQWVETNYERTQEVAGRFRRVAVSRKIRELPVVLIHQQARAGMGMVTGW